MAPQFSMEERNFISFEYHKRKGNRNFKDQLVQDLINRFPGMRRPSKILCKQMRTGTILNSNSKSSLGVLEIFEFST